MHRPPTTFEQASPWARCRIPSYGPVGPRSTMTAPEPRVPVIGCVAFRPPRSMTIFGKPSSCCAYFEVFTKTTSAPSSVLRGVATQDRRPNELPGRRRDYRSLIAVR